MARHSFSQLWAAAQAAERHALERQDHDEAAATAEEETAEEDDEETRGSAAPQKRRASSAGRAPKRVRRRNRKPTYLLQKEEREVLLEEIRILEARAELLKLRSGLPTSKDLDSLASKRAANVEMEEKIHANLLSFARCQSLLSREIILTPINPMKAFIHLPRNIRERRNILRNMKDMRLRRGEQLAAERLSALDKLKPYTSEERFTDPDGTFNCKRFDIVTFEGLDSCREVYEALLYFLANVEISVTETLGHLTIREDSDEFDPTIWNHRVISRNNAGYTEEMNVVGFTRFHDALNFGVVACDSVNVDDLHPYVPAERVRKDITSAHTVSEYRDPTTNELVVVLKRVVFLSVHPPQFPVSRAMREAFQEQLTSWAPVLTKLIRDKVYADREDRRPSSQCSRRHGLPQRRRVAAGPAGDGAPHAARAGRRGGRDRELGRGHGHRDRAEQLRHAGRGVRLGERQQRRRRRRRREAAQAAQGQRQRAQARERRRAQAAQAHVPRAQGRKRLAQRRDPLAGGASRAAQGARGPAHGRAAAHALERPVGKLRDRGGYPRQPAGHRAVPLAAGATLALDPGHAHEHPHPPLQGHRRAPRDAARHARNEAAASHGAHGEPYAVRGRDETVLDRRAVHLGRRHVPLQTLRDPAVRRRARRQASLRRAHVLPLERRDRRDRVARTAHAARRHGLGRPVDLEPPALDGHGARQQLRARAEHGRLHAVLRGLGAPPRPAVRHHRHGRRRRRRPLPVQAPRTRTKRHHGRDERERGAQARLAAQDRRHPPVHVPGSPPASIPAAARRARRNAASHRRVVQRHGQVHARRALADAICVK